MTDQDIRKEYEEGHLNKLQEMIIKQQIDPFIHIIAREKGEEKPVILHIPIPASSDMDKELFVRHGFPSLKEEIKKNNLDIIFITFTTEAWIRKLDKNKPIPENYRDIPPDEVLFISYSSANEESVKVYDIIRDEFEVNDKGELIDKTYEVEIDGEMYKKVEIKLNEELSVGQSGAEGKFSNLYKQLT